MPKEMPTAELLARGINNIEDARFIRDRFIPVALAAGRWNVVVHQAYQATELLIKGMICIAGHQPLNLSGHTTHKVGELIERLLHAIDTGRGRQRNGGCAVIARFENGCTAGVWLVDGALFLVEIGTMPAIISTGSSISSLTASDILNVTLATEGSSLQVSVKGQVVLSGSDSCFTGSYTLEYALPTRPGRACIEQITRAGDSLKKTRETSFYSETTYNASDADNAIGLMNEINIAAANFLIDDERLAA